MDKFNKKSQRKQRNKIFNESLEAPGPDFYYNYSTLPPQTAINPYATTLPMHGLQQPCYINQSLPSLPVNYYNVHPQSISYTPGDIYGPPAYVNNYASVKEDKKKEFQILLKGLILFLMMNFLVSDSLISIYRTYSSATLPFIR